MTLVCRSIQQHSSTCYSIQNNLRCKWKISNTQSCIKYSTSKYQYQYHYHWSKYQYKYQYFACKYMYHHHHHHRGLVSTYKRLEQQTLHHRLRGSVSTVVTMTRKSIGKRKIRPPVDRKPLKILTPKLE